MQPPPGGYPPPRPGFPPPMGYAGPAFPGMMPHPGMMPPGMMMPPPGFRPPMMRPPPLRPTGQPVRLPQPGQARPQLKGPMGGGAPKSTTVYVGKIAPTLEDAVVKQLLEACGPVKSWKRMTDPETNQPKGFGFCEFEEADGVMRALSHLSNLAVDGQELLLKCNAATQKYIDDFKLRKAVEAAAEKARAEEAAAEAAAKAEQAAKEGAETAEGATGKQDGDGGDEKLPPPPAKPSEASEDDKVLEKIMGIVSERAPRGAAAAADQFLGSLGGGSGGGSSRRDREPSSTQRDSGSREDLAEARRARDLEAAFERQREKERRAAEEKAVEAERAYRDSVRKWEKEERDRLRDQEKEVDRAVAAARDRARAIRADEADDSEEEPELWRRVPIFVGRRAEERRKRRQREEAEDAADREAEAEEKRQRRERGSASPGAGGANGYVEAEPADGHGYPAAELTQQPEQQQQQQQQQQLQQLQQQQFFDPTDPIYQAMMAAAQAPSKAIPVPEAQPSPTQQQATASPGPQGPPAGAGQPPARRAVKSAAVAAAFGDDEEEDKPKRKLIPLQYTPAELAAAGGDTEGKPAMNPAEVTKRIAAALPSSKEAVFAHPIDWATFDAAWSTLAPRLSGWVDKKIQDMLGEREESMVSHIMSKLQEHCSGADMLEELQPILDEDAEGFVIRLYRALIFDNQKLQQLGRV